MSNQPGDSKIEVLGESTVQIQEPDPTAEEAQRTLEQANAGTAHPPQREEDTSQEPKKAPVPGFQDPRMKIAEGFRAARQGQMTGTTEDMNDPRLTDPNAATAAALEQAESGQVSDQPAPAAPPAKQMVKVKVDGQEMEVPLDDLVSNFQKDRSADQRLQRATEAQRAAEELLARVKTGTAEATPPTKSGSEGDSGHTSTAPTGQRSDDPTGDDALADVSDEDLMDTVEKLMTGSADEAVKSLKKVLKRPAPQSQQPVDVNAQVERAITIRDENRKSADALEKFAEKHKAVKTDKVAEAAMSQIIRDELLSDLRKANVPEQFIEQFKLEDPAGMSVLKNAHKELRARNFPGVRSVEQILGVVGENATFLRLVSSGAQPAPQIQVDRGERKAGVQAQPALRTAAPTPPGNRTSTPPTDRAAAQRSAFEQMRKSRGQSAYGG